MPTTRLFAIAAATAIILITVIGAGCQSNEQNVISSQATALQPLALSRIAERQATDEPSATMLWLTRPSLEQSEPAADRHQRQQALNWSDGLARGPRLYSTANAQQEPAELPVIDPESVDASVTRADAPFADNRWWQKPLAGRTGREIVWEDIKIFPRELWKSTKDTANVPAIIILGAAGGLSAVARNNWDDETDDYFRTNRTAWSDEGDFGGFISNPFLHFGLGLAGYAWGVHTQNDEIYGFSKTLLHALTLNGIVTQGLKWAANDRGPNGESWAWPSGHTSHIATVAAVVTEYYGPLYGVPVYLLAGWGGVSRINDREHWLSDVIMGFAIGSVVGHSVARGRMLEAGGFTVMPYVPREGGAGLMFVRRF